MFLACKRPSTEQSVFRTFKAANLEFQGFKPRLSRLQTPTFKAANLRCQRISVFRV